MKREEEIANASTVYSEYEYNQIDFKNGFFTGAKWADENPKSSWINMKREEEIANASTVYSEYEYNQIDFENGFIAGARWSDENPK